MDKIAKNLQLALMVIILISTVIAVGIEMKNMVLEPISDLSRFIIDVSIFRSFSDGKSFLEPAIY